MSDRHLPTDANTRSFKRALLQRFSLRWHMGLILAGVAISAILANGLLRAYGLRSMSVRYALATTLAYTMFYLLVWIWLAYVRRDQSADSSGDDYWIDGVSSTRSGSSRMSSSSASSSPIGGGGRSGGGGASATFGEAPAGGARAPETRSGLAGFFGAGKGSRGHGQSDDDDSRGGGPFGALGALLVFILPLIVIGAVCYHLVSTAPDLLGEIAFQAILARAVLGRAFVAGSDTWPHTAFRRTLVPFAIVLVVVVVAGGYAQYRCPRATTLVEVLRLCSF